MGLLEKKEKQETEKVEDSLELEEIKELEEVKEVIQEKAKVIGDLEEEVEEPIVAQDAEPIEEVKEEMDEEEEQDLPIIITENQLINMKLDKLDLKMNEILRLLSNE